MSEDTPSVPDDQGEGEDRAPSLAQQALERAQKLAWDQGKARTRSPRRRNKREQADADHLDGGAPTHSPGMAFSRTGARPSRWDPQPLGAVIDRMQGVKQWKPAVKIATVAAQWPQIVGPQVSDHCQVESFHDSVLVLRADSTAWAKQLQLLVPVIERRIDEKMGVGVVTQVVVRGPEAPTWKRGKYSVRGRGPRDTYG